MNYNFDEIITRRGSNCIKWDEAEDPDIIPLWVADMDFHVYPGIVEALRKRVEHGVFGYSLVPQSYYDAVIRWFRDRHGAKGWKREHFIYTIGVLLLKHPQPRVHRRGNPPPSQRNLPAHSAQRSSLIAQRYPRLYHRLGSLRASMCRPQGAHLPPMQPS